MAEETEVLICGCGPTGALLSGLLSQLRVPNVVLEREAAITTDPRGIVLDEDGIRAVQALGVYDKLFTEVGSSMWNFYFVNTTESDMHKAPFTSVDISTSDGSTGHPGFLCHKQPELERVIRSSFQDGPYSQLKSGCVVTAIEEDSESVTVQYEDSQKHSKTIRGRFLVGADGKTGFVRKKYLEPRGITMDVCEGKNYDETWVAMNLKITIPTPDTHPDFPLWAKGYSPVDVYNYFFPREFRFLCNPHRPAVCGRFGLERDKLWRFEFVVHPGEDGSQMSKPEETQKIVMPYLTHAGRRFGLKDEVKYPEDCIEILRSRPFSFQARSCNKWALGRVILTGDAAHVFPPFGGQGIASGFRDALGLAWRLALLYKEPNNDYTTILKSWYVERKQQFERSLVMTIRNGEFVTERSALKASIRDWSLWLIQLVPKWRRELEKGPRAEGLTAYHHEPGLPFKKNQQGGRLLPQVYVWDFKSTKVHFSDDLVFARNKTGLLQLILLPDSVAEARQLAQTLSGLPSNKLLNVPEATILIQDLTAEIPGEQLSDVGKVYNIARLASGEEFAADPMLCFNRPVPKYYEPRRIAQEFRGMKFMVVRHDRFVYAACRTSDELATVLDGLQGTLLQQS